MELGHQNYAQRGHLNLRFYTFANLVNKVGTWQETDLLVLQYLLSPTEEMKVLPMQPDVKQAHLRTFSKINRKN